MESTNRISTHEAEQFAGVSETTLLRFADAGYLAVEEDTDGMTYFSKKEICTLFNLDIDDYVAAPAATSVDSPQTRTECAQRESAPNSSTEELTQSSDTDHPNEEIAQNVLEEAIEEAAVDIEKDILKDMQNDAANLAPNDDFSLSTGDKSDSSEAKTSYSANALATLQQEVSKLERVIELQEQLLDSREAEIDDLKNQRVWLRERLEKAEQKGERDQLLLISEMQMLTRLVNQTQKRSVLTTALAWLGFKDASQSENKTIDYQLHKDKREQEKKSQAA